MTLKEYVLSINTFLKENPHLKDTLAVYAIDDEGNAHHPVMFSPTEGVYRDYVFEDSGSLELNEKSNAVCIN